MTKGKLGLTAFGGGIARRYVGRRHARQAPRPRQAQHPRHHGRRHRLWNISAYNRGMMGYRTPNIDRIAKEGAIFTDYYGQQSLHGRPRRLHHRPVADPHRSSEGRPARRHGGPVRQRPDHRRTAQAAGLRDRPVRQEPSRRPQRIPADRARLRRVLRQPLSPQRRGGAGEPRLPQGPEVQGEVRPARRAEVRGEATRRRARIRALVSGASRVEDTGPLTKKRMETIDEEFLAAVARFHRPRQPRQASRSSSGPTRRRMHIWTHLKTESRARPAWASTPTAWSSTTAMSASC